MGITHATVASGTDAGTGEIHKAEWNAAHTGADYVLLEQHTGNNTSSNLDFTTFISSTYDEYLFELVNVLPASSDVALRMRMGTGGGPTYDTSSIYGWMALVLRAGGSAVTGSEGGATYIQLQYGLGAGVGIDSTAAWGGLCGTIRLFNPASTVVYKTITGDSRFHDTEPFRLYHTLQGTYESATAVTAVRFFLSSSNIASGTIRVYGIGK